MPGSGCPDQRVHRPAVSAGRLPAEERQGRKPIGPDPVPVGAST